MLMTLVLYQGLFLYLDKNGSIKARFIQQGVVHGSKDHHESFSALLLPADTMKRGGIISIEVSPLSSNKCCG